MAVGRLTLIHLLVKLETGNWKSESFKVAFKCIVGKTREDFANGDNIDPLWWIQSKVVTWGNAIDLATKRAGVKDAQGDLTHVLVYSGRPLKEFTDCIFRQMRENLNTTTHDRNDEQEPEEYKS